MVSSCHTASEQLCGSGGCSFSCSCMTCVDGDTCNCSCTPLVALGIAIIALSALIAVLALREHRRFLAVWAVVYAAIAGLMTMLTLHFGPDPHLPATLYIGCTIPAALWVGCLLVCILSCYTTDYIRSEDVLVVAKLRERFVYDPQKGFYVLQKASYVPTMHVTAE